jgi:hypothetical protein
MTTSKARDMKTFITDCIEVLGIGSTACAAELGMAFRAWVGDPDISDDEVVARIVVALGSAEVEVVEYGGSSWLHGVQLSPVGEDMVIEGVLLHAGE